jgi:hypothetical protein
MQGTKAARPIRGWVYIITNPAMPGLVKVGYSSKDPRLRASELNSTGLPHSYDLIYDALVQDPREIERTVHQALRHSHEGKEWFRCSPMEAMSTIKRAVSRGILAESFAPSFTVALQSTQPVDIVFCPTCRAKNARNNAYCKNCRQRL